MSSFREIIQRHHSTFYRFDTNAPEDVKWRIATSVAVSAGLSALVWRDMNDFLDGVITVQAILIGFSFSVMFFLVSSTGSPVVDQAETLESGLRRERLSRLATEIFYNLSYFNLVALGCLISALVLLLPDSTSNLILIIANYVAPRMESESIASLVFCGFFMILKFLLFFSLIESGYTFFRTTRRVSYLFGQKIQ